MEKTRRLKIWKQIEKISRETHSSGAKISELSL